MKVFRTAALAVVAAMVLGLMAGATARADEPAPRSGKKFEVKITWSDKTDVDLHMKEPDGTRTHFLEKRTKNGGNLSRDANASLEKATNSPEEVFEIDNALVGKHSIMINMYNRYRIEGNTRVTVRVYLNGTKIGEDRVYTLRDARDKAEFDFDVF